MLFGEATGAILCYCTGLQDANPLLAQVTAALLLDQEKAFELLDHSWLRHVFASWKFPGWLVGALLAQVEGRTLRDALQPGMTLPTLRRGAGMGASSATLTWNIGFDPISWIAGTAAACRN